MQPPYSPDTRNEREPTTVPAHNLYDERPRVASSGALNGIDGLADTVQRGRRADSHVGHAHVIVDRADETDYLEVSVSFCLLGGDAALVEERRDDGGPFRAEEIRTRKRAVSATHDERVDALLDHIVRRGQAALARPERRRAGGPDQRSSLRRTFTFS